MRISCGRSIIVATGKIPRLQARVVLAFMGSWAQGGRLRGAEKKGGFLNRGRKYSRPVSKPSSGLWANVLF